MSAAPPSASASRAISSELHVVRAARLQKHQQLWIATTAGAVASFFLVYNTVSLWRGALTTHARFPLNAAGFAGIVGAVAGAVTVGAAASGSDGEDTSK